MRTTPLNELISYAEQAYEPSECVKKLLITKLKKIKLELKRKNAKKRNPSEFKSEEYIETLKQE